MQHERQMAKEETVNLTDKLDQDWKSLRNLMSNKVRMYLAMLNSYWIVTFVLCTVCFQWVFSKSEQNISSTGTFSNFWLWARIFYNDGFQPIRDVRQTNFCFSCSLFNVMIFWSVCFITFPHINLYLRNVRFTAQPSPQAFSARSFLDSTMSCDVTERYSPRMLFSRPLFPRLRADNGSRENT